MKTTSTKNDFRAWFSKIVEWYVAGLLQPTYGDPTKRDEYDALVEALVSSGACKAITDDNKFYIVGLLDAYTSNRIYTSKKYATELAVQTLAERELYERTQKKAIDTTNISASDFS